MSSNKETFLKGVSVQTVVTFIMGILEIAVFAIMSRILGKEEFGYFAALTGVMTICTSITEAGLGAAIIQKKDASESFVSTAFSLSWLFGFLGTAIVFLIAPFVSTIIADKTVVWPLRVMSLNIFLACVSSVGRSILVKQLKFKMVGKYTAIAYILSSIIGVSMAFMGAGLWSVVAISVLNLVFFDFLLYVKCVTVPKIFIDIKEIRGIMSYGGWLTLSVIVNNVTQQMDRLFLSKWISVTALGSYNRPAGFVTNIASKINGIFDAVLFPMLSSIQNDKTRVKSVFLRAVKSLNSFSIVLFAIFFFNADLIVTIFFGTGWLELVPILRIVSVYIIFNIDSRLVDCFFRSLAMVDLGFRLRVVSAFITFVFLYVGARYDITGVAVSLVLANAISVLIKVAFLSYRVKVSILSVFLAWFVAFKPVLLLCLIGIPYLLWMDHSFFCSIVFAVFFGFLIVIEFVFLPQLVGKEYVDSIYPSIKKKILRRG